jgi:hypothetical protein
MPSAGTYALISVCLSHIGYLIASPIIKFRPNLSDQPPFERGQIIRRNHYWVVVQKCGWLARAEIGLLRHARKEQITSQMAEVAKDLFGSLVNSKQVAV